MFNSLPEVSCAAELYFNNRFPGYRLKQYRTEESGRFCFILEPSELGVICPKCQQYCLRFKDTRTLTVLDYDNGAGGPCVVLILEDDCVVAVSVRPPNPCHHGFYPSTVSRFA